MTTDTVWNPDRWQQLCCLLRRYKAQIEGDKAALLAVTPVGYLPEEGRLTIKGGNYPK